MICIHEGSGNTNDTQSNNFQSTTNMCTIYARNIYYVRGSNPQPNKCMCVKKKIKMLDLRLIYV